MNKDAERDVTSRLPQLDADPAYALLAPENSVLGRMLRRVRLDQRAPGGTAAAFANYIGDRRPVKAHPRSATAEACGSEQSPFRLEVGE